jgi:hypothetical protein
MECKYVGSIRVDKSSGMDVLNEAIWKISKQLFDSLCTDNADEESEYYPDEELSQIKMIPVRLSVSPSKIYAERNVIKR